MADYIVQNEPELVDDTINKVQNLEQNTGQNTDKIMSQKTTTDMIFDPDSTADINVKINSTTGLANSSYKSIRIGSTSSLQQGDFSLLIGGASLYGSPSRVTAVGFNTLAHEGAVALGESAVASSSNSIAVGRAADCESNNATSLGYNATCTADGSEYSMALGSNSFARQNYAVALGAYSAANVPSVVSVGDGSSNSNYGTRRIVNVRDPQNAQDAATKNYVDIRVPIPPSTGTFALQSVEGVTSWVSV